MPNVNILILASLFSFAGLLAIIFHRIVPDGAAIRRRFPIQGTGWHDVILPLGVLAVGAILWLTTPVSNRAIIFQSFIIGLLSLESGFLLFMRRYQSTAILSVLSALCGVAAFFLSWTLRLLVVDMLLFVFGTLGAWTLVQRLGFLKLPFLTVLVIGLTAFDYLHITSLTKAVAPSSAAAGASDMLLVSIGQEALGIGDFIFLSVCTLALIARFGSRPALLFVSVESLILIATSAIPASNGFFFPYLLVMTPVFLMVYLFAWVRQKHASGPPNATV